MSLGIGEFEITDIGINNRYIMWVKLESFGDYELWVDGIRFVYIHKEYSDRNMIKYNEGDNHYKCCFMFEPINKKDIYEEDWTPTYWASTKDITDINEAKKYCIDLFLKWLNDLTKEEGNDSKRIT